MDALIAWVLCKVAHQTKDTARARGAYDNTTEAHAAGITFDVLEDQFTAAVRDVC